ncbi:hypothetical protein [Brevundimonas sp.]|uniref:hypothetical protein n=1 Tax=Brevundimonas sp. TaxID=1871086 RepID=UPI0028981E47|nr:hypothetical protein [Brevundimonas sp.]
MTDPNHPSALVSVPRADLERVRDLLMERIYGSNARSPGHNARLEVEAMIAAAPAAPYPVGVVGRVAKACADFQEAIDYFEADVADVMAEGSERADLWDREVTVNIDALKAVMNAALCPPSREPEGGAVDDGALKIATDLHAAYKQLIYGLPKYLDAENLTDEENMIREAWITLDVTAHRLAALAARADPCASHKAEGISLDPCCPTCEAPAEAGAAARIIARHLPLTDAPDTVCLPITMTAGDLRTVYAALRAQPQGREDAQPVDGMTVTLVETAPHLPANGSMAIRVWDNHGLRAGTHRLYLHPPAPSAYKLRTAMPDLSSVIAWLENGCDPKHAATELTIYKARIDQTLAALQAEQKGGAA